MPSTLYFTSVQIKTPFNTPKPKVLEVEWRRTRLNTQDFFLIIFCCCCFETRALLSYSAWVPTLLFLLSVTLVAVIISVFHHVWRRRLLHSVSCSFYFVFVFLQYQVQTNRILCAREGSTTELWTQYRVSLFRTLGQEFWVMYFFQVFSFTYYYFI